MDGASEQQFFDGDLLLYWEEVLCLVPGMTPDELASYQNDKWARYGKQFFT